MNDLHADCEKTTQPYLDHVLTDEEMARVEAHVAECEQCRKRYLFEESLSDADAGRVSDRLDSPDEPEADGGVGVREPPRPKLPGLSGAAALPRPDSDEDA